MDPRTSDIPIDSTSMVPQVLMIYATWQEPDHGIIPELAFNCPDRNVQTISGVGVGVTASARRLLPWFLWLLTYPTYIWAKYVDGAIAYSMERRLQTAYEKIRTESQLQLMPSRWIVMGCSRGGFMAQMLAHHVDANPIAGNQPDLELYVFDPVGTHGLWSGLLTVVGRSPLPTTFMGYNTGGWANCIRRARVILMEGENRASFEPNVYRVQHPNLQQIWFYGVHDDAWGPSRPAFRVLAFVWQDMFGATYQDQLEVGFKRHWNQRRFEYPVYCIRRRRRRVAGDSLHWSISQGGAVNPEEWDLYNTLESWHP